MTLRINNVAVQQDEIDIIVAYAVCYTPKNMALPHKKETNLRKNDLVSRIFPFGT
jgi:hypothetical protein